MKAERVEYSQRDSNYYWRMRKAGLDYEGNPLLKDGARVVSIQDHNRAGKKPLGLSSSIPALANWTGKVLYSTIFLYVVEYDQNLGTEYYYEHGDMDYVVKPASTEN